MLHVLFTFPCCAGVLASEKCYKVIFAGGEFKLVESERVGGMIQEKALGTPQEMFAVQVFDGVSYVTDGETKVAACSSYFLPEEEADDKGPYSATDIAPKNKSYCIFIL